MSFYSLTNNAKNDNSCPCYLSTTIPVRASNLQVCSLASLREAELSTGVGLRGWTGKAEGVWEFSSNRFMWFSIRTI